MARPIKYRMFNTDEGHLWFCVLLRAGWTACYRLIPEGGRPQVAELRIVPTPPDAVVHVDQTGAPGAHHEVPGRGLTAATIKDEVVLGRHVYEILPAALKSQRQGIGSMPLRVDGRQTTLFEALFGSLGFDPDRKPERGRRGPKGWPDRDYAALAADYLDACSSGSRSPVKDVAERRGMTPGGLRAALHRARKRGLLTRQTAGRAGGQLTPRAKKLLKGRK